MNYLLDSNVVIDYLGNKLPANGSRFIDNLPIEISIITKIEILGWYGITKSQFINLKQFIDDSKIYHLNEGIINQTIQIRQLYKIKTPDAIIAATSIFNELCLITRNVKDFGQIQTLNTLNLYDI